MVPGIASQTNNNTKPQLMKVLIACESSGIVREAFKARGHDVWSCDLLDTDIPGQHIKGNVIPVLNKGWDLMIAHPPCTYLSKAGARWLYPGGIINRERYKKGLDGREFFMALLNAPIERIAVENPTPFRIYKLPAYTQIVQPYEYGHPYSKRTLLWLRNLPNIKPTNIIEQHKPYLPSNTGGKKRGQHYSFGVVKNSKESSTTFSGMAEAMAEQWG